MRRLCAFIATIFCLGYAPIGPGTIGSLSAVFFYYFIKDNFLILGISIIFSIVLGLLTAGRAARHFGEEDPRRIIIDEFSGMLVSLFLLPSGIAYVSSAFLLFRFFDIVKPYPIRRLERLGGGLGIMADDIIAGLYANLILQFVNFTK